MSNPSAASAAVLAPGVRADADPHGARPRRIVTPRNIILYGTLCVAAVY